MLKPPFSIRLPMRVTGTFYFKPGYLDLWETACQGVEEWSERFGRDAAPSSAWARQATQDLHRYGERTPPPQVRPSMHLARSLVTSSLNASAASLKDASLAMTYPNFSRPSALALMRIAVEASATCVWITDSDLDLDMRLRRASQLIVRTFDESANRFLNEDAVVPGYDMHPRDFYKKMIEAVIGWARDRGWKCANGKAITARLWKNEIPGYKRLVGLASEETTEAGESTYSWLSGAIHSDAIYTRYLELDDSDHLVMSEFYIAVKRYWSGLAVVADVMGWDDHDLHGWFYPMLAHIQSDLGYSGDMDDI